MVPFLERSKLAPRCHGESASKPFLIISKDDKLNEWSVLDRFQSERIVVVPLAAGGDLLGAIIVDFQFQPGRELDEEILNLLELYGRNVAETIKTDMLVRQFLRQATHQLVTPAAAAWNALEDLREDKENETAWTMLESELRWNLTQTNELLHFARIESARLQVKWEPVNLFDLLVTVELACSALCGQRKKKIKREMPENGDWNIRADENMVKGILSALLKNAITYSEEGTPVTIRLLCESELVTVCMINDGPGIPQETRALLTQSDNPLSPLRIAFAIDNPKGGLGIGYSIARRLVEAQEGRIEIVESWLGRTEVRITFKRKPEASKTKEPK